MYTSALLGAVDEIDVNENLDKLNLEYSADRVVRFEIKYCYHQE